MNFLDEVGVKKGKAAAKRLKKTAAKNAVAKNKAPSYSYLAATPPKQLYKQTQATIRALTQPILGQINKMYNQQQRSGLADITRANQGFVTGAGQYPGLVGAADQEMIHGQELLDAGIRQFLSETGQKVTGGVMGQQQAAGAPVEALAATTGQVGGLATGITTEALGQGASTLSRMLSQKAADLNYGNLLPNVARAAGTENVNLFTRDIGQRRAAALGEVTQQVPGLVATTYQNLLKQEVEKESLRVGFQMDASKAAAAGVDDWNVVSSSITKLHNDGHAYNKYGEIIDAPGYTPTTATTPGSKDFQRRLDSTHKNALRLGQLLLKGYPVKVKANGKVPTLEEAAAQALLGGSTQNLKTVPNAKAYAQIYAMYDQDFPNQSFAWKIQQVRNTAVAAGYTKAGQVLAGVKTPADYAKALGVGIKTTSGAPTGGAAKTKPKTTTTTTTTTPTTDRPSVPGGERAQTAAVNVPKQQTAKKSDAQKAAEDRAKAKTQAARASQAQKNKMYDQIVTVIKQATYPPSEAYLINYLHTKYRDYPLDAIRAIVRSAMGNYPRKQ